MQPAQPRDASQEEARPRLWTPSDPTALILHAYDVLNHGLLVVSQAGEISYYNQTYARLRHLVPGELVGHRLEEIDRRRRLRTLLHTGSLPEEEPAGLDLRRNEEVIVPVYEAGQLVGAVVVVVPQAEPGSVVLPAARPRSRSSASPWAAQYTFADLIGQSPALQRARDLALRAARSGSPVLLLGESGTGKELFAHAIHAASPRRSGPFVPVDCAAIPHELLEAELFGYAPGAFSGALREGKPGKFELAHGGTVFLDEIGEMPLDMQAKLLRVLQERRLVRVGGITPIPVDFAVIAATNQDLDRMVAERRFRHDLLYRLDVIRIEIPPLRERREDVVLLLEHFWEHKNLQLGTATTLSPAARQRLIQYPWPGNIREMLNLIERLLVSVPKRVIEVEDLPLHVREKSGESLLYGSPFDLQAAVAEAERQTIAKALQRAQGNRNKAAELVGLSRASFYRKLKEYGLNRHARDPELLSS
ncbi:MAG: sigma-54-dependent Fis family transcriptional regulator [Candidatus Tectimicrobiota bacterium]|nr:MAG: sigma-54-dependent Fis family transcriptional regulator [Candidatus Tectomicrobia bacterium]